MIVNDEGRAEGPRDARSPAAPSVAATSQSAIAHLVGQDVRVLQFGCGAAAVAEALAARGCRVVAVESERSDAALTAAFAEHVVLADPEALDYFDRIEGGAFDVILFVDFLEIASRPDVVLERATTFLNGGGAAVVALRNQASAAVRRALLTGSSPFQRRRAPYRRRALFTLETARELLAAAGLAITHVDRIEVDSPDGAAESESLPAALEQWLSSQPEAHTYQFVFRCVPAPLQRAERHPDAMARPAGPPEDPVARLQAQTLIELDARIRELQELLQSERQAMQSEKARLQGERVAIESKLREVQEDKQRLHALAQRQAALIRVYEQSRAVKVAGTIRRAEAMILRAEATILHAIRSRGQ